MASQDDAGPRRRRHILGAARRLFAAGGRPSIAEVAAAARVSRATVYRTVGSREALLDALDIDPDPGARSRILAAAVELIGRDGLNRLAMEEVAARADVSRASLYRLFAGKSVLFREVIRVYSPLEAIAAVLEENGGLPPEEVIPEVARTAARSLGGRMGLIGTLMFEVTSSSADAEAGIQFALATGIGGLLSYLLAQMEAGRLRRMHPVLALQGLVGPVMFHLVTRPLAERYFGIDVDVEDAVTELALSWVRAMSIEEAEG